MTHFLHLLHTSIAEVGKCCATKWDLWDLWSTNATSHRMCLMSTTCESDSFSLEISTHTSSSSSFIFISNNSFDCQHLLRYHNAREFSWTHNEYDKLFGLLTFVHVMQRLVLLWWARNHSMRAHLVREEIWTTMQPMKVFLHAKDGNKSR